MQIQRRTLIPGVATAIGLVGLLVLGTMGEQVLRNPLLDDDPLVQPERHAPVVADALPLDETLTTDLLPEKTYVAQNTVRIPKGATVRIPEDTRLLFAKDARLVVEGSLIAERSVWGSNESRPEDRLWHGITVAAEGHADLRNITVHHASAAVTCAPNGTLHLTDGVMSENVVGIVILPNSACTVNGTTIQQGRVGIHILGGTPRVTKTRFAHLEDGLRVYGETAPVLADLSFADIGRAVVLLRSPHDLSIRGLRTEGSRSVDDLILDGTETTEEGAVPSGRVRIL